MKKKGILIVALLSLLVACGGGDSPTAPSYMAPPSGSSTTGQMLDLIVKMYPHNFDPIKCDAVTIMIDSQHKGVLKKLYKASHITIQYPEGSTHILRAVSCLDEIWEKRFTMSFPGVVINPFPSQ